MKLHLKPYGPLIPVLGEGPREVDAPVSTAAELLDWLHQQHPALNDWRQRIAVGVGEELLSAESPLQADSEVALIPPVSGG